MTPDTQQARAGHRRPQGKRRDTGGAIRVVPVAADAARAGRRNGAARPAHASHRERPEWATPRRGDAVSPRSGGHAESRGHAGHAREDASIVRVVPLLAVLVIVVGGVYIAWFQGATGGREGGVVAGCALLAAAAVRLLLPAGLSGLLAVRKRSTDVCTLAVFGIGLLVVGLVLPR
jgi:hypothetical protein